MIELGDVRKVFNAGRPNEFVAVRGISLSIEAGKATFLTGPSGSGKTTLLGLIGCMARPSSGRIWLQGRETTSLPERFLTDLRRRTFGFIFQQLQPHPGPVGARERHAPGLPDGRSAPVIRKRALGLFETFDLAPKADARAEWLSGGEAQRLTIVRALMNNPAVIIADEPTAHLDTALTLDFLDVLGRLKAQGRTILIAGHDPLVSESPIVDRVVQPQGRDDRGRGGLILDPAILALLAGSVLIWFHGPLRRRVRHRDPAEMGSRGAAARARSPSSGRPTSSRPSSRTSSASRSCPSSCSSIRPAGSAVFLREPCARPARSTSIPSAIRL